MCSQYRSQGSISFVPEGKPFGLGCIQFLKDNNCTVIPHQRKNAFISYITFKKRKQLAVKLTPHNINPRKTEFKL